MYLKRIYYNYIYVDAKPTEEDLSSASVIVAATTMDVTEPVNLNKAVLVCNVYNFFFAASKACLFPFFSIFLRLVGLTALQTGIIIASKTLVAFIFAPLWTKCAVYCRKRKLVFMFAIFMMAATYLSLTLVANHKVEVGCGSEELNVGFNHKNKSVINEIIHNSEKAGQSATVKTVTPGVVVTPIKTTESVGQQNVTDMIKSVVTMAPTLKPTTVSPLLTKEEIKQAKKLLLNLKIDRSVVDSMNAKDIIRIFRAIGKDRKLLALVDDNEIQLLEEIILKSKNVHLSNANQRIKRWTEVRKKRDINVSSVVAMLKEKLNLIRKQVQASARDHTFMLIIIVVMIGEMLCCPVEKLADDYWFDFLEKIDELEKYGKHRIWCSIAYIIFPLIVAIVVDNTKCLFHLNLHPFMLHFYMFGAFLGLTFLLAFFYPLASTTKGKYKSKMKRGLKTTCCSCVGLLYVLTLLLTGIMYAAYYNYLFWTLQDLSASESVMGMCITISTLSEIPMLLFSQKIIKKLGNGGIVCLSLLAISGRTLFYSYLWTPWAVLPAEILHGLTHTALWCAVLSHPSFNLNPTADRSMRSILSSVYFGLGFATGSIVSGAIYDTFGSAILYRSCSVLAIIWFPIFGILQRCCHRPPENEIRYTQLLQSDDHSDEEAHDDWLEKALKNR